jgi:hypothetical protein
MSDEETTRILKRKSYSDTEETAAVNTLNTVQKSSRDEDHTRIFRPTKASTTSPDGSITPSRDSFSIEPVVGWLVITEGPGKGQSLKLGFGMNSIGRANDERISLDFGDEEISRKGHAQVTYDPKGNKFYLQHGGGINLTYLGDSPVLQAIELKGRELISIGNTKLAFIPFCGTDFSW